MLPLCLVHLGYLGAGMLVSRLLGFSSQGSPLRRLLVSYCVGLSIDMTVLYAAAAIGPVPHSLPMLLSVSGVLLWFVFFIDGLRGDRVRQPKDTRQVGGDRLSHRIFSGFWLKMALVILLLPPVFSTLLVAKAVPIYGFDGIVIWASKAAGLFHGEHLKSPFFVDQDRVHAHPGYPIGLPLYLFHHTAVRGSFDEILLTRALAVGFLLWLLAFFELVSEFAGPTAGIAGCVILMYTPVFYSPDVMGSPLTGFADFPLGALVVIAVGWLFSWVVNGDGVDLLGASAALTGVASVKNEGLVWACLVLGLGLATIGLLRTTIQIQKKEIAFLAVPVIGLIALRMIHAHLPSSSDVRIPTLHEVVELFWAIPKMAGIGCEALGWRESSLAFLPVAVVVGYGMGWLRQRRNRYALLALVGPAMWLTILLVLGLTEVQLGDFDRYVKITFPRLLLQAAPVSLYWAIILNSPLFPKENAGAIEVF